MGRDTDIYRLDKEKAKTNLYADITSQTKFKQSFCNFLAKREDEIGKTVSYQDFCNKVQTDINLLLPSELFELTFWLEEMSDQQYDSSYHNTIFDDNGIELLINLHGSDAYAYLFQLGNFSEHFELESVHEDSDGMNIKASYFVQYLEYMILLMNKILQHGFTGSTPSYSFKENRYFSPIIDSEITYLKKCWAGYNDQNDSISYSKLTPETQTIYQAEVYLNQCLEMKKIITKTKDNIIIVDSI